MPGEEVAIVAIVFGSILSIVFLGVVGSIINSWIKKKNSSEDITKNKEFLSALRDFKEKTERRISNLEEIVSEDREWNKEASREKSLHQNEKKEEHSSSLEIEIDEEARSGSSKSSGNLRNMLNQ